MNLARSLFHVRFSRRSGPPLAVALLTAIIPAFAAQASPAQAGTALATGAHRGTSLQAGGYPLGAAARVPPLATVRFIRRGLTVQPPHHARERGRVNMALYDRYFLETGSGQEADIRFRDGTTLYMAPHTDVTLKDSHRTNLRRGQVDEVVAQGTNHQVQTAQGLAVARGTDFDVSAGRRGTHTVVVHGTVLVRNAKGRVMVQPNQATFVPANRAPQPPRPADAGSVVAWTKTMPPADVVQVVAVTKGSFEVTFTSKAPGKGQVSFGSGPGCTGLVQVATSDRGSGTTHHDVLVTGNDIPGVVGNIGMTPGARYYFQVTTIAASTTEVDNNHGRCYTVLIPKT